MTFRSDCMLETRSLWNYSTDSINIELNLKLLGQRICKKPHLRVLNHNFRENDVLIDNLTIENFHLQGNRTTPILPALFPFVQDLPKPPHSFL